ncbi:MAG: sulfatase-like hydrolase/transferase [Steroidobacteraceae bacterium]
MKSDSRLRTWGLALVALLLLNGALSFASVWPTFWIQPTLELSVEAAALLLVLAAWQALRGRPSRALLVACSAVFVLLVFGHYGAVMSHSLYGRDINVYFDAPHVANVGGMFVSVTPVWLLLLAAGALALFIGALFWIGYWSLRQCARTMTTRAGLRALSALAVIVVAVFAAQSRFGIAERVVFTPPVTGIYATQAALVRNSMTGGDVLASLGPAPALSSDFARLKGADVLVMFIESYGAVAYDRPDINKALGASRADFAAAVKETHRAVASAFSESPTFAGGSWLAHLSLMSGYQVKDPGQYAVLMAQQDRDSLPTVLQRKGYRTVGLMPGIRLDWPEGRFYRFDELLDEKKLEYRGPEFGWWRVPDQYSLAKFDAMELEKTNRAPLFLLFTSINTHLPFLPTPPYQPDWQRLLSADPFDAKDAAAANAQQPDWLNMGNDYAQSVDYVYRSLAGYLRKNTGRDFLLIVLGDHQPAANVSGEDAPWDTPVHVIASNAELLQPLMARGFVSGVTPKRPSVGTMSELLPMIAEAMDGKAGAD